MLTGVTVDTNVLASGFVNPAGTTPPAQILDAWRARLFDLILSDRILTELARTFDNPYFRRRLSVEQARANIALLRMRAWIRPITVRVEGRATQPEDDLILATAVSGGAEFLVTGDLQLQNIRTFEGISILSPRTFVETVLPELQPDRPL